MAKTNTGLVAYAKAQLGNPYWYGTYGQTASASLYEAKKKQYPAYYTATNYAGQYGKRVHDCVGLIKGYLWSSSATGTPTYNAAQDKSAKGMYAAATTKGTIATFPKTAGLLVFKGASASSIHHVGVYGGDGYVYEAKGHAYGTVKTAFKAADWTFWAQCPYCTDDAGAASSTVTQVKASEPAMGREDSLAGTYTVTASYLNVRNGAGTGKAVLCVIPKGTRVQNYGYYTAVSGKKWLYVQLKLDGVQYTGFCSECYLKKGKE